MIYFDNAATGFFKPDSVYRSAEYAIRYLSANPSRSAHRQSACAARFVYRTRKLLSEIFNNRRIERVIFTKNCTEALNTAIFGIVSRGSEVVTTVTEHNSVLRPLYALARRGIATIKFARPKDGRVTADDVLPLVTDKTSLVVVNAVSNVTGRKNDFEEIGRRLRVPYLVDGAQAAGHININMTDCNISALAVAGHKGLYAISGTGALIFRDVEIAPTYFGGTGTESFSEIPSCYPELLESGTLNLAGICTLYDGATYAAENLEASQKRLNENTEHLIKELKRMGAAVFSEKNPFGIVAFAIATPSTYVSEMLSERFDIAVRGGFHCAPLMHKFLGTESDGLIRVSLCPQNTQAEIEKFLAAVQKLLREGY